MSAGTLSRIDKQLDKLDPETLRYKVLVSLRQFRASWVELGRLLTEVAYGGDYKEWGYEDFEIYCARELGLKKPTVKKLMVSYNYMKSYEPKKLEDFEETGQPPAIPDYQTVELLHRARNTDGIEEEEKQRLHDMAFGEEEDETVLRKDIRERIKAPMSEEQMSDANRERRREIEGILRLARNLRTKLAHCSHIPGGLADRFEQLLVELEAMD